ncbi:MAG: GAF domain-containing protein [Chloroflexi bacterium]|nr:GAF domain-containing protein [Chloroflexota bacterium]
MAQIVTSARRWPSSNEDAGRSPARAADRTSRSRHTYLAGAFLFSILTYGAVELIKAGGSALTAATADPAASTVNALLVHATSLIAWIGACLMAGLVAHHYQSRLGSTLNAATRRGEKLALVNDVGGALTGPLPPNEIATKFLQRISRLVPEQTTAAVYLLDEAAGTFSGIAANGPLAADLATAAFPVAVLPEPVRALILKGQPIVTYDLRVDMASVGGADAWATFCRSLPGVRQPRSFALLPLLSRGRLVGVLLMRDDDARTVDAEPLHLLTVLTQFLAGALHNALSVAEAEARAERAALINRVARHAHASLDHEALMASTLEELGMAMGVSAALVQLGASAEDLHVAYEWPAPGVTPVGVGGHLHLPISSLAVRVGGTIAVTDLRTDIRLNDDALGQREDHLLTGAISALATPISLGNQLVGVLLLHMVERARTWTNNDVLLVEAVARELRVALETARLLEARTRESDRLLALHRASTELATHTDTSTVIQSILRNAVTLLGGGSGSFFRWDAEAGLLRRVQSWQTPEFDTSSDVRPGEGLAGLAFAQGRPIIVNDYQTSEIVGRRGRERGLRAGLGVPLVPSGKPLGVLLISSYDDTTQFTEDDARLLDLFGDQAAAALMTAEAFEEQGKAVAELERLNKVKSEFVAIVSHEFRTPLTGIQGFSEMMRDEDLSPEEMKEYAADINKDARRLNRLVNEMLDLSRMESGRIALMLEPLDLNAIVADVAATTQPNAPKHRFALQLDDTLPLLVADRDKLTQVVTNLVSNAVKYSPDGGQVTLTTRAEGNVAHLMVTDKGVGMPKEMLERVFEPYSRVETGTTRFIRGTGLGLPIARQIVKLHGGRVWADSVEGKGSTFHCLIPVGAMPRAERPAREMAAVRASA